MAKKKKQASKPIDAYPKVIETFSSLWQHEIDRMKMHDKPSSFNSIVNFRRYRVTIELIDEPIEILAERLEKLWVECDNHHHWLPLESAAASIGYTFKGERGSARNKK